MSPVFFSGRPSNYHFASGVTLFVAGSTTTNIDLVMTANRAWSGDQAGRLMNSGSGLMAGASFDPESTICQFTSAWISRL